MEGETRGGIGVGLIVVAILLSAVVVVGILFVERQGYLDPRIVGNVESVETAWTGETYQLFGGKVQNRRSMTNYVVVRADNGTRIRCYCPFPKLEKGDSVKARLLPNGEWTITSFTVGN